MSLNTQPDHYTVMGNPILHSLSPQIHRLFAQQTAQRLIYTPTYAPLDAFGAALRQFVACGGKGANITLPFKMQAFKAVDRCTPRAIHVMSINTITVNEDLSLTGDNTDGVGFVTDIVVNQKISLKDKRILILGSGGSAKGVVGALLNENVNQIVVMGRTFSRAQLLVAHFKVNERTLVAVPWGDAAMPLPDFDIIVHTTAAGVSHQPLQLPNDISLGHTFCYDLSYGSSANMFLDWAKSVGTNKTVDGFGMLVEQAAQSFYLWRGVRPDTAAVLAGREVLVKT